jgi:hypothetical protein
MCQVHGAGCGVRGAWYEVRGARYEAQDTRYVVRGTGYTCWVCQEVTCKDRNNVPNTGASWVRTPLQEGELVGAANSLCFEFTQKWNELCFVNTRMLTLYSIQAGQSPLARWGARGWIPLALLISLMQIAHKFDACVLFGMHSACMRYMVHGMRYEVRGMRYMVHSTEYVVRGTRYQWCKTLCMITDILWWSFKLNKVS